MTITFPLADNTESILVTDILCQLMELITRIVQVATLLLPPVTQLSSLNTQLYSHAESTENAEVPDTLRGCQSQGLSICKVILAALLPAPYRLLESASLLRRGVDL